MTQANKTALLQGIDELASALKGMGRSLENCDSAEETDDLQAALVEVLPEASEKLLDGAKTMAKVGGRASRDAGVAAGHVLGFCTYLARGWDPLAVESLESLAGAFETMAEGVTADRDALPASKELEELSEAMRDAADGFVVASDRIAGSARLLRDGATGSALTLFVEAGPAISSAGAAVDAIQLAASSLAFWIWDDECTCGQTRWVGRGIVPGSEAFRKWVWQECVKNEGWICDTCEWQDKFWLQHPPGGGQKPSGPPEDPES